MDLWLIIGSLPVVLITSVFLGFEVSFYYGVLLLGLSLWKLSSNETVKKIGIIICSFGTLLFFIAFVYYLSTGTIFPENPLDFKLPSFIFKLLFRR